MIKNGTVINITSEKVCVGDVISLSEDDVVPCDAIVLSSSHESHQVKFFRHFYENNFKPKK